MKPSMSLLVALAVTLAVVFTGPLPVVAANPSPVQIYYVTLPEPDGLTVLSAINGDAVAPMYTYFSIAIAQENAYIYYDQWENGYAADIANPTPAEIYSSTTNPAGVQIWGNGESDDGCAPNINGVAFTCTDLADVLHAGNVIIPYNAVPLVAGGASYVLDNFNTSSLSNDNGSVNWSSSWVETGDDGAANGGAIRINSNPSGGGTNQLRFTGADVNDSIDRGVNLSSGDACATLSFSLGQFGPDPAENFAVQMSPDGSTYTTLDTFTSASPSGAKSYTLSPSYFTANARVRFILLGDALESTEYYSVDDARIQWGCAGRDPAVIRFDGRDKVGASSSIAMARATWATGSETLNAFAHEMYATSEWGTEYEAPVGQDTTNAGQMFEYSGLSVMASQNNTTVQVDANADGIYGSFVLQEGGSRLIGGILQGARVQSDKPVQVVLVTGDIDSVYASRDMNLLPMSAYGSSYWSPVGVNTDNWPSFTAGPTRLYLYNPSTNGSIYITCERYGVANTTLGPIAPRGVATIDLVDDQGARCFASTAGGVATTDKIFAIGTVDTENTIGDWSFTLYPDTFLSTNALVGLGLGRDPNATGTENSSPLWVTSACASGGTYVYVDWNNDGTADPVDTNGDGTAAAGSQNGILVNRLQSVRLFKPSPRNDPYDQSGARVWSRTASGVGQGGTPGCNLALAWGQDPRRSTAGSPGLDVGTSIPPLRLQEGAKSLALKTDADGDGQLSVGDTATYRITIHNIGAGTVNAVTVSDTAPTGTTYVANTTQWSTDDTTWTNISDPSPGVLPLIGGYTLGDLASGAYFYVRFDVLLGSALDYDELLNCETTATAAGTFQRCADTFVATRDWGDLPDSYGTTRAANGPRHSPSALKLGALWDDDVQGRPSAAIDDDSTNLDDEDGIVAQPFTNATTGNFQVTVTGGPGCLNAWMDFTNGATVGGDGDFGDTLTYSEQIVVNQPVNTGTQNVSFNVPSGFLTSAGSYYARFRLSPTPCTTTIAPTGFVSGGEVEDYQFTYGPLAVDLASFTAESSRGGVTLAWETVSEQDLAGFNVYRSAAADQQGDLVASLPAQTPGSGEGASYTWLDPNAVPDATYFYWLEDVSQNGTRTLHGPASVTYTAPNAAHLMTLAARPVTSALPWAGALLLVLGGGVFLWRRRR